MRQRSRRSADLDVPGRSELSYDFTVMQGGSGQVLTATLLDQTGTAVNLTGGTVTFVLRAQTATGPTTMLPATLVNPAAGAVQYKLTAADTAYAGTYLVQWQFTAGGVSSAWPLDGYQELSVNESLSTPGGARLVSLSDIKQKLRIATADRSHDARLLQLLDGLTPVIEGITGPILQRLVTETYDGGTYFISLRRRPVIEVSQVTEYRGPIPYPLGQVSSPDLGGIYTYMFETPGRIVRRTAGGGITTFPPGPDAVTVSYKAGYYVVPANVREATLELVRVNYQIGEQAKHPAFGQSSDSSDNMPTGPAVGFFVPGRVRELLAPSKRHPSVA